MLFFSNVKIAAQSLFLLICLFNASLAFSIETIASDPHTATTKILLDNASRSLVYLKSNGIEFNGVIVSSGGMVLTVSHGIKNKNKNYTALLMNGKKTTAKVIYLNLEFDIAVLQLAATTDLDWIKMRADVSKGESVYSIGRHKRKKSINIDAGKVMMPDVNLPRFKIENGARGSMAVQQGIIHSAFVEEGYSGGMLVDSGGRLVGVNNAYFVINKKRYSMATNVGVFEPVINFLNNGGDEPFFPDMSNIEERVDFLLAGLERNLENTKITPTDIERITSQVKQDAIEIHNKNSMTEKQLNVWISRQFTKKTENIIDS
ncbi:MAG: hypothetical protein COB04_05345 [Gammaproteobacteria bacterium]|nr:MAG: hypothetical protein COB04_05345 [Gammaproteobacteria bacterium]